MGNERNAGRKRKLDTDTIARIIDKHNKGHSVSELAREYGVSRQTMSFYINDVAIDIDRENENSIQTVIRSISYWRKLNKIFGMNKDILTDYNLRLDYMCNETVNTHILVNYKAESIIIKNNYEHPLKCAFGVKKNPSWEDYLHFLEERCVPKSRDHMSVVLDDYGLDFFDPMSIVEKTGGRMSGDSYHIRIYSLEEAYA